MLIIVINDNLWRMEIVARHMLYMKVIFKYSDTKLCEK